MRDPLVGGESRRR